MSTVLLVSHSNRTQPYGQSLPSAAAAAAAAAPSKKETAMNTARVARDSPTTVNLNSNRSKREPGSLSGFSFGDPLFDDAFPSGIRLENTYQLHPTVRFPVNMVREIMDDVLRSYLTNEVYQEELCREMAKTLSEVVKVRIRELQIPRYRFICRVDIGQLGQQDLSIASSFLWDADSDNFCTCEFKNNSLFAVCTVFAIYTE